jgi:hypothetical protein
MRTKTNDIYKNILLHDYDIILITETWLKAYVYDGEFIDERYTVYRRDRTISDFYDKMDGGGLLIAVKKSIISTRLVHKECRADDLWILIDITEGKISRRIGICLVYTLCLSDPLKHKELTTLLENVTRVAAEMDEIMVMGDFNLSFIKWSKSSDDNCLVAENYSNKLGHTLVDFLSATNLSQRNDVINVDDKILDLVLTNISCSVSLAESLSKVDPYHPPLEITLNLCSNLFLNNNSRTGYNYFKADYYKITSELRVVDWEKSLGDCNHVEEMVSIFYDKLNSIVSLNVPKNKTNKSSYPVWFTGELIKLLREKNKLRQIARRYRNPRDRYEFDILRKRCDVLMRNCFRDYICIIECSIKKNPRVFWSYIKSKKNSAAAIPCTMHGHNGELAVGGKDIANLFATSFRSNYNKVDTPKYTCPNAGSRMLPDSYLNTLSSITVSEKDVLDKLKKLNTNKGMGPDNIPPLLLKRCAHSLAYPLKIIFEKSLTTGIFPNQWKRARIIPVFKKGNADNVSNYRPIAILSSIAKVFESIVCDVLTNHSKPLIRAEQHGFQEKKSVVTNLIIFLTPIMKGVDSKHQIDAIYTDFASAFDRVDHHLLIKKLHSQYGVCGRVLNWLASYLKNREQTVSIQGYESNEYTALSGVPQGSHLGPILFLLFVNDIVDSIHHCQCSLFADDMKISRRIDSIEDSYLMQSDLDRIGHWCYENKMALNASKCQHICFTKKRKVIDTKYVIDDVRIATMPQVRDLGIILDSKLSFVPHFDYIINKAAKILGFVKRNTKDFRCKETKILLFKTMVRSILEFGSVIWNPYYTLHSQRIESLQRSFTRHLAFNSVKVSNRSTYEERLRLFKMNTLCERRRMLDLVFLHNIVRGSLVFSDILDGIQLNVPVLNARRKFKPYFKVPRCRTNLGLQSPITRLITTYNDYHKLYNLDIFHDRSSIIKCKVLNV